MKKIVTLLVAFVFVGLVASQVMAAEPAAAPEAKEIKCKVGDKVETVKTEKECTDKGGKIEK